MNYDIQYVGKIKSALFGGEGLFFATLRGPGTDLAAVAAAQPPRQPHLRGGAAASAAAGARKARSSAASADCSTATTVRAMIGGMARHRAAVTLALALVGACAVLVHAQQIWVGGGEFSNVAPRFAKPDDFDGSFLYCRGFFGGRFGARRLDHRLSRRRQQFFDPPRGTHPRHRQVRHQPPAASCRRPSRRSDPVPLSDAVHGERRDAPFTESEVIGLRTYLQKGGFLWVDDFWGSPRGPTGSVRSRGCCRPASIRSSTSRSRTRSCTRCTT